MTWFYNRTIRAKLIIGFGVIIVLALVLGVFAMWQLNTVSSDYSAIFGRSVSRRGDANAAQSYTRGLRRVANGMVMHAANTDVADRTMRLNLLQAEATSMFNNVIAALASYDASVIQQAREQGTTNTDWDRSRLGMSAEMRRLITLYYQDVAIILAYARAGDHASALEYTVANIHIVEAVTYEAREMVAVANEAMDTNVQAASDVASQALTLVIVVLVILVIMAVIIALAIAQIISKPVQKLVVLTGDVANGQLNINMDRRNLTTDEIGNLTADVYNLVDVIKEMVSDIGISARELSVNGDIEYRIDANKYKGGYKEMIEAQNGSTEGLVSDVLLMLEAMKQIGDGDFNFEMKKLPGKKMVLTDTINGLLANLKAVNGEVNEMIVAAADKGNLAFKIDADKYKGGWNAIMVGLNNIAAAVDAPLTEINSIMANLARGDFSKQVSGRYAGDFKAIQDAVNTTITTLSGYITEISDTLSSVANGDLTVNVRREYVGEFQAIKDSLNNIAATLRKTMSEIAAASTQVLAGAKQISSSAMDLANGASEQASSVEELNASIDMINQQTQQNASAAGEASSLSNRSTSNAQEGNEAMKQMLVAMNGIKESSASINGIIKAITDIAFQTNLLSLNASVEAARAGEHGRGFSVVADEVRSLANRSQNEATATTNLINESISRVETGLQIAETTSNSLNVIVQNANEVSGIINGISTASKEQADAIAQVSVGLQQVSGVVQSNSAVSEEAAAAAEELTSQAEVLQELVGYFKL